MSLIERIRKNKNQSEIATEKVFFGEIPVSSPTAGPRLSRDPFPPEHLAALIPCRTCSCPIAWESIYFDGELRCAKCQPFPSIEFVGRKVAWQQDHWEQRIIDGRMPEVAAGRRESQRTGSTSIGPTLADDVPGEGLGSDAASDASDADSRENSQEAANVPRESETESEANDRYDRFVEGRTRCGRTFYARRGWDQPSSPYFNQRLCMAVGLAGGVEEAEEILGKASRENSKVLR